MRTLDQAREYQNQGNYTEVDAIFEEILQEEPKNAEVIFMLAKSKMNQNKLDEALAAIDRALALNSEDAEFSQIKGSILARMGQHDAAIEALKKSLQGNPNNYQSQIILGHLYYSAGQRSDAEIHFKMALKIDADRIDAQVNLAKILLDDGAVEKAIKKLTVLEQQFPQDPSVKMMMGQAFLENNAYSFAEKSFEKVMQMLPDYALAKLYLGITKIYTGDLKFAEAAILGFNQKFQNVKEGLAAMGLLFFKRGRFKAAQEFLKVAIADGIAPLSWRRTYAETQVALGELQQAIAFYKQSTSLFENTSHSIRLAELYEMNQQADLAIKEFEKVNPNEVKYILALLGMARCELLKENYEKTEQHSQAVLEINPHSAEAILLLVNALLFQDKQEQALTILQELKYGRFNYMFKKTLRVLHALVLDHQQRYEEAMAVFTDPEKTDEEKIPKIAKVTEQDVKKIQSLSVNTDDDIKEPIFVVGTQSTDIHNFAYWLSHHDVNVLNDRLISPGREDIFHAYPSIQEIIEMSDEKVEEIRKKYHEKVQISINEQKSHSIADCLYTNPHQMALIKKFFPKATVILLTRNTADIWLNQIAFGEEQIDSKDWNESINQIISMGLNLVKVNIDDWHKNNKETLEQLSQVFATPLVSRADEPVKYWRQTLFNEGHWKNYTQFLV